MLKVESVRSLDELYSIRETWKRMQEGNQASAIVQSWIWNSIWCEQVAVKQRGAVLDVKLIFDGAGRPQAILPLYTASVAGPAMRVLQFIGHRMPVHHDILLADSGNPDLAEAVVSALRRLPDFRTVLHLRRLEGSSLFTRELVRRGFALPQDSHLWVEANPSISDQADRLGKSRRAACRRHYNKLQREHGISFTTSTADDIGVAFETHMRLHDLRWRDKPGESIMRNENREFLHQVTRGLALEGKCEFVFLHAGERVIASILCFLDREAYCYLQSGFDPDFAEYSPMRLLINEAMRRGFEEMGRARFDMGGGYDRYKLDWKPVVGTSYFSSLPGSSMTSRIMARAHRLAFQRRLPPSHLTVAA